MGQVVEIMDLVTQLRREYFLKCIEKGFTPDQALRLTIGFKPYGIDM